MSKRNDRLNEPFRADFEAIRAVVSQPQLDEIERIRLAHMPDERLKEFFWRVAREEMVSRVNQLPDGTQKIVAAKVGAVGARLGLSSAEITKLVQKVDVAAFAAAARANISIQEFQKDPRFRELWTEQTIQNNPPIRSEFEHATVFGSISDAGDIAGHKSWGALVDIQPLQPNDRLFPMHIAYTLKATSRLRMRWEFRDTFRNILGSKRALVTHALRNTKRMFLAELGADDVRSIRVRLDLTPEEFWLMCRQGERFGPNGIHDFVRALEEKTKGYVLPFPEVKENLVQIQTIA